MDSFLIEKLFDQQEIVILNYELRELYATAY